MPSGVAPCAYCKLLICFFGEPFLHHLDFLDFDDVLGEFLGFLVSWFLGFLVSWFLGFWVFAVLKFYVRHVNRALMVRDRALKEVHIGIASVGYGRFESEGVRSKVDVAPAF